MTIAISIVMSTVIAVTIVVTIVTIACSLTSLTTLTLLTTYSYYYYHSYHTYHSYHSYYDYYYYFNFNFIVTVIIMKRGSEICRRFACRAGTGAKAAPCSFEGMAGTEVSNVGT